MREIALSNGKGVALVDDEDFERVSAYAWHNSHGYAYTHLPGGKKTAMQRMVMGLGPGDGGIVDHDNHNTLDNQKNNLICGTQSGNLLNRAKTIREGFSSKYRGVAHRGGKKKQAVNRHGNPYPAPSKPWLGYYGKRYLGTFATEEEAAYCRDLVALLNEGPRAQLNFPIPQLRRA